MSVPCPPVGWRARLSRARRRIGHSLKLRMVLLFLVLAGAMTLIFVAGAQRAFSVGWREAARPLLIDYVDRLSAEIAADGTPDLARAQALVERLPLTLRISGPRINWASHPDSTHPGWRRNAAADESGGRRNTGGDEAGWRGGDGWRLLRRSTTDGHTLIFGINGDAFESRPHRIGVALAAVLLLTLLAWLYVRRLLRPLEAIGEGARRFGRGDFAEPIAVARARHADELGELATTINTMGQDIHQMLEAKRALLLAISHELRSPLTRARLNAELLPESSDVQPQRDALLRDLKEMAGLIADLLESERLAGRHAALQREAVALPSLVAEVKAELGLRFVSAASVAVHADADLPTLLLDPARMRLLLRNLLDNALRHGGLDTQPPEVSLSRSPAGAVSISVRDFGAGVSDEQLTRLSEAFYRPDSARSREHGGVGLGLYLCRLIAQAHGASFAIRNAHPGLQVVVSIPDQPVQL